MKYAKIEIINLKNKRKTSHLSISLPLHLYFYGLTFIFFIFILIHDLFPLTQSVSLPWNFSLLIPAYQSAITKRYSSSSSALPLFLSFSVLPKIKTQVYFFNLNYIYFSLLHTLIHCTAQLFDGMGGTRFFAMAFQIGPSLDLFLPYIWC